MDRVVDEVEDRATDLLTIHLNGDGWRGAQHVLPWREHAHRVEDRREELSQGDGFEGEQLGLHRASERQKALDEAGHVVQLIDDEFERLMDRSLEPISLRE